jgi:hypothetical protein
MDPHQIKREDPDPHQNHKLDPDPDPHLSDKLDPDPDPHQFADDKPKCMEYEPISSLFKVLSFHLEATV